MGRGGCSAVAILTFGKTLICNGDVLSLSRVERVGRLDNEQRVTQRWARRIVDAVSCTLEQGFTEVAGSRFVLERGVDTIQWSYLLGNPASWRFCSGGSFRE